MTLLVVVLIILVAMVVLPLCAWSVLLFIGWLLIKLDEKDAARQIAAGRKD